MKVIIDVRRCYHTCPYFFTSMDGLECRHPYWNNKGLYKNLLNREEITKNADFPATCPLKNT